MHRHRLLTSAATVVGLVFFEAVAQDRVNRHDQARQAFLASPKEIYVHYCAHCHGDDGKGGGRLWSTELSPPPADLTALKSAKTDLIQMIRDGSAAQGRSNLCPPWGRTISPERIERLAQYILTLNGKNPVPPPDLSSSEQVFGEPFPWLIVGVILLEIGVLGAMVAQRRRDMRRNLKAIELTLLVVAAGMGAGCSSLNYIQDAPSRVKTADWSKMESVVVDLSEFAFSPANLVFRHDVPYRLTIRNRGQQKHYFAAESFYRAIATRKVQSTDGEVKAPYLSAIEVFPGHAIDVYFIPVRKGTYPLACTVPGHAVAGMTGQIRIE